MSKKFCRFICAVIITASFLFYAADEAAAAEVGTDFYTYLGPYLGVGYNFIKFEEWNKSSNSHNNVSVNGPHYALGCSFQLYLHDIVGDFKVGYMYNQNSGGHSAWHFQLALSAKYLWQFKENLRAGTGLGIYAETPPSSSGYDGGAGLILPICSVYDLNESTKFFTDLEFRIGSYGGNSDIGAKDSRKLSIAIQAGVLFRVGKV